MKTLFRQAVAFLKEELFSGLLQVFWIWVGMIIGAAAAGNVNAGFLAGKILPGLFVSGMVIAFAIELLGKWFAGKKKHG